MELKDFINATLQQIIEGVAEAQEFALDKDARINPASLHNIQQRGQGGWKEYRTENIEFDVAVTAIEGTETKGRIGIASGILNLGAGGQSNAEKQSVSRIKFNIAMQLPSQDERQKR